MALQAAALTAYRNVMRAQRTLFRGDSYAQSLAVKNIRARFEECRNLTDPAEIKQMIAQANEAVEFLRTNVVQATLNERGNFEMTVDRQHAGATVAEPDETPSAACGSGPKR